MSCKGGHLTEDEALIKRVTEPLLLLVNCTIGRDDEVLMYISSKRISDSKSGTRFCRRPS